MATGRDTSRTTTLSPLHIRYKAEWVLERWEEKPSLLRQYGRMVKEIRAKFECGQTAAEQAIKLARAMLREGFGEDEQERKQELAGLLEAKYLELMERAAAEPGSAGAVRAARIGDMLASLRGLKQPVEVEVTTKDERNYGDLSDEQIAALRALDPDDGRPPTTH